jgi:hypothetical protein
VAIQLQRRDRDGWTLILERNPDDASCFAVTAAEMDREYAELVRDREFQVLFVNTATNPECALPSLTCGC